MSFQKPKTIHIQPAEYLKTIANASLQKDLLDNEVLCEACHGTGIIITDNEYGLSEDPDHKLGTFPYKKQTISFCKCCYNGVRKKCRLCGELIPRHMIRHNCEAQQRKDDEENAAKRKQRMDMAEVLPDDMAETMECFYSENYPYAEGYFLDWEDFFSAWVDNFEPDEEKPEYVYATEKLEFAIDAYDMVTNHLENFYEDAYNNIKTEKMQELQRYLEEWCATCGVGKSYVMDYRKKIRIPWEDCMWEEYR